jgi:ATP-dependent 26S proteasome regulatory subunit
LYKLADFVSPSVIILEDLDLFSNDRERGGDMLGLGSLMNVLDGVNSIYNAVTLGTTNRLETIEKALTNRPGRFDRIVEISPLDDDLRRRMFENRLEEWEYEDEVLEHLIAKTGEWTGAESQEFINTLNLKLISSDNEDKKIDIELVNEIIEIMQKFGVGESSGKVLGFGQRDK